MLSVMALAVLTTLGVAYDGYDGNGYPNTGFGQQNDFGPGQNEFDGGHPGQYDGMGQPMGQPNPMGDSSPMSSEGHNYDHGAGGSYQHHDNDGHKGGHYDWLSPVYTYNWGYPNYYYYGYYPYTNKYSTYYYTSPVYYYTSPTYYYTSPVYSTYYYPDNWYDPWWSANVYGVWGTTHYYRGWS
jgi:hypothetical protein